VKTLLEACAPRPEILSDTFSPEIFTAAVRPVVDAYEGKAGAFIDGAYTDPVLFFGKATYPTDGMKQVVEGVCRRLRGLGADAIYRLDTAFGGGKTHILIALTHIALGDRDALRSSVGGVVSPDLVPDSTVSLAVVDGSTADIERSEGGRMVRRPLWATLAEQITGGKLGALAPYCQSGTPPGQEYFDLLFSGGRKCLILLDELAHYAMRLEAGSTGRAEEELASFLKSLTDAVATRPGVALVVTFASSLNAFGSKNDALKKLFTAATGRTKASADETDAALAAGFAPVQSVLNRFASGGITPVQPGEMPFLLAQRLFSSIDRDAAREAARDYMAFYRHNAADLPEAANLDAYGKRIETFYPFHPSFIDYLNDKLAASTEFQGTRGVLRVLSLAVRSITRGRNQQATRAPCIHVTDLDLRDAKVADLLVPADLKNALNTDVGGPETGLTDRQSRAAVRDETNAHPEGVRMHELTWRAVFLNSLAEKGKAYGVTEPEAALQVGFPGLAPSQVNVALAAIADHAWYLKYAEGRYFAQPKANLNQIINMIASDLGDGPGSDAIAEIARTLVKAEAVAPFTAVTGVTCAADVDDKGDRLTLAIAPSAPDAAEAREMFFSNGAGQARRYQNALILLTTKASSEPSEQLAWRGINWLARIVVARQRLGENPVHYGIDQSEVGTSEYRDQTEKKAFALRQSVGERFTRLWFPQAGTGDIISREITGSMNAQLTTILKSLRDSNDILSAGSLDRGTALQVLQELAVRFPDPTALDAVLDRFRSDRTLPVVEDNAAFVRLVGMGLEDGRLVVYRVPATKGDVPKEIYWKDGLVAPHLPPISGAFADWGIVSEASARRHGWIGGEKPLADDQVRAIVVNAVADAGDFLTLSQHFVLLSATEPLLARTAFDGAVEALVHKGALVLFAEKPQDGGDSEFIPADQWPLLGGDPWVLTDDQAEPVGSEKIVRRRILITDDWDTVVEIARNIGSLYAVKGATSRVASLTLRMSGAGARADTTLHDIHAGNWRHAKEVIDALLAFDDGEGDATGHIEVADATDDCPLAKLIRTSNARN